MIRARFYRTRRCRFLALYLGSFEWCVKIAGKDPIRPLRLIRSQTLERW